MGQYLNIARAVRSRQVARKSNESGDQEIRETPQEGAAPVREKPQAEPVGGDLGKSVDLDSQAIRNEKSVPPEMSQTADEEVSDRVGEIGRYLYQNRDKLENPNQAAWEDPRDLIEFGFFDDLGFSPTEEETSEGQRALLIKDGERIRAQATETESDSGSEARLDELENVPGEEVEEGKGFDEDKVARILEVLCQWSESEYTNTLELIDRGSLSCALDFEPSREEVREARMRFLFGSE